MTKKCEIAWNVLSVSEWEERFKEIRRSNLLQSYEYALAMCPINQQSARWGLIRLNGQEAGLVQIMEVGLLNKLVHVVMLDRGPLWFDGYGTQDDIASFFTEYDRVFKPRIGRKRRIIPETAHDILPFKRKLAYPPYQTIWLDITHDENGLREGLKKNWRGALKKAEEAGLEVKDDQPLKYLTWLLKHYEADKASRGYESASSKTISALAAHFGAKKQVMLLRAQKQGKDIAAILIFIHGAAATYQIGWTDPQSGRKNNAHHFLLWQAIMKLKALGIKDLDLGGVNDFGAKGVKKFKEGLGGELIEYCGQYK